MAKLELKPHEETFEVVPVGVRYKCEFCNEGEQIVVADQQILCTMPPLRKHRCNKCGKEMNLPQVYPRIEWVRKEDVENDPS